MKKIILLISILFFVPILYGQNITVSKDTLKYLTEPFSYPDDSDNLFIYNTGEKLLVIDSIMNFNITYHYLLEFYYKDSLEKRGYFGHAMESFPDPFEFPLEIPVNDSAECVFYYIPPVTKTSTTNELRKDSIFIYNNSVNKPVVKINVLNDIPLSVENEKVVHDFQLLQNYPNPFNPITSIEYKISRSENVVIQVYDITGSEITTLINGIHSPGNYKIVFNASELPSGVYLYKLQTGKFMRTRKMLLLK